MRFMRLQRLHNLKKKKQILFTHDLVGLCSHAFRIHARAEGRWRSNTDRELGRRTVRG